jgi:hypothetical protein
VFSLYFTKIAYEALKVITTLVKQAITWFQVSVYVVGCVEMRKTGCNILKEGINFFES